MNAKAKKATLIMALVAFAFFMDANNHKSDMQTNALQAGTFLGTGVKVEKSPCFMGTQVVTRTVMLLGIEVGDSWQTEEPC